MSQWVQGHPQPGFQIPMQTGFPGANPQFQHPNPQFQPPNPQFQPPNSQYPQQGTFLAGGLVPQPTGFPGPRIQGFQSPSLQPQPTGFPGPLMQGFMPPSLQPQPTGFPVNLQQSYQQRNQSQATMSWALSKTEKKQYNDIFRSWDATGTGFISGQTALQVFGASDLSKDDLARIWTLADRDDRGKLNIAEFHVAMGLIYRRLNGMPIPDQLPPELVPPSARDLDSSVDLVKDLLRNETRSRSPSALDVPISRLKNRSFNSSSSLLDSGRDATIYKHSDSEPPGSFYQPRSRHINRDDIRSRQEDSPSADLSDMKRRLASTAQMLDRAAAADAARTVEDEEMDREMDDLKYRVKRVSDDLEYVSRGPKSTRKDQEKRELERELMTLMHERVPNLERKIKEREERREQEKRAWARDRDRKNEGFGRYARDNSRYDNDRDRERPYSRGNNQDRYDREIDRDRERGSSYRARSRSRDRKDYDRPRSPPPARSSRPPPSPPLVASERSAPSPVLRSTPSPAPQKMTTEERQTFAKAEAQRRIQARMAALGVTTPSSTTSSSPVVDTSVEDRLLQEKKEAEERTRLAEKQAEERERIRRERVENERALKDGKSPLSHGLSTPSPTPTKAVPTPTTPAPAPSPRSAPPPKPRAPAPPPPRRGAAAVPKPPKPTVSLPPPATAPKARAVDPEEEALRIREAAIKKQREAHAQRLRQLELEEREAKAEEERYLERVQALKIRPEITAPHVPTSSLVVVPTPPVPPPPPPVAPVLAVPPSPPPLVAPLKPVVDVTKSTNPFSRLLQEQAQDETNASNPSQPSGTTTTNPWARPQTAPPSAPPSASTYHTAPTSSIDDDWDDIQENIDGDSSDDELAGREKREDIARQLFGGMLPSPASRPESTAPAHKSISPPIPPAPPAPLAWEPLSPPPPPPPPLLSGSPPPPPSSTVSVSDSTASPGERGDLMRSIQGGLKLRPTKTVDKSGTPISGRVLGDNAPPAHISDVAQPHSPIAFTTSSQFNDTAFYVSEPPVMASMDNRQSVGWFTDRAVDAGKEMEKLPSMKEECEEMPTTLPTIQIHGEQNESALELLADIDKSIELRARTLYSFEGDGPDDLSFKENLILTAHPSKSGGEWWFGVLSGSGKSGVFPKTFVQTFESISAKALYDYVPANPDELAFNEGEILYVVDRSEEEWWKVERKGVVFIVPAAYLEAVEG